MTEFEQEDEVSPAEEVYGEFLARSERDAGVRFEDFCREHAQLEPELRRLHARWCDLAGIRGHLDAAGSAYQASSVSGEVFGEAVTIDSPFADGGAAPPELMQRLRSRATGFERYRIEREIGRGGMGRVLRAWDPDLRRTLAMKVVRAPGPGSGSTDTRLLARFLEEAQISGQLDHPGIVPLHEIGMAPDGEVYFTMKLVNGESLREVFARCAEGKDGWTRPRVVGVLQKVCEAVSYAHAKGVVHRDLKPTNVMVGHFGEVYVMDWGLARILGAPRVEPLDSASESGRRRARVETDRHNASDSNPESPIYTVDGDVIGTPAYMSPEQAQGSREEIGPLADVYSLGAMLYQHLTGSVPYVRSGESLAAHTVIARVREGPPVPIHRLAPAAPIELVAICERAMARSPRERYASVAELGEDLRAFLEGRVVRAYRTGAWTELKKWVARNRTLAATAGLAVLTLLAGLIVSTYLLFEVRSSESRVMRMSDLKRVLELREQAEGLYPPYPELVGDYERWLDRAERLVARAGLHRATLAELRTEALPASEASLREDRESHPQFRDLQGWAERIEQMERWIEGLQAGDPAVEAELARVYADAATPPGEEDLRAKLAEYRAYVEPLERGVSARRTWVMPSTEQQWEHDTLAALVEDLESLAEPERGLVREIRGRLEMARTVGERSVHGAGPATAWREASESLRDRARCPEYAGLELEPQMGFLPVGRDPWSGLWEFALVQTGEIPVRNAEGQLEIDADSAMVFVLIPGGSFWMGAQRTNSDARSYDPQANVHEGPVHQLRLDPFFLSKYEMTQRQWLRVEDSNPSYYREGSPVGGIVITGQHPVEQVSWNEATRVLSYLGLELPTEAQWEYAARAHTYSPWFDGFEKEALLDAANICDASAHDDDTQWGSYDDWLDDGYAVHAPVGSFRPNPFGLHNLYGNVFEHCRDFYSSYTNGVVEGTGERRGWATTRVLRGGSFDVTHETARASNRGPVVPTFNGFNVGLRPSRAIQ